MKVCDLVHSDHRLTIREMSHELNLSFYAFQSILTKDLTIRRVSAKFIPKLLSDEQKQHRLQVAQEMINQSENDPDLLNRVITGDKSWVYGYDPETKAQSSQWKSPGSLRQKKHDRVGRMWRRCWWSFLILKVLCITRNTIKVLHAKTWGRKGLHSGKTRIGSSTWQHAFSIIEFLAKFLYFHNPHIPLILPLSTSTCFLWKDTDLTVLKTEVETPLESVCSIIRRFITIACKYCHFEITSPVLKLSNHTSYVTCVILVYGYLKVKNIGNCVEDVASQNLVFP